MEDPEKFKAYTKEVRKLFSEHPVLGESLKRFGTGGIVDTTNARNIIPTHNFKYGNFRAAMRYYRKRGWDAGGGIRLPRTLDRLQVRT